MFYIYLLAGISLLAAVIAVIPIDFRIRYGREGEKDLLSLDLFIWPVIRYKYRFVMIDFRSTILNYVLSYRGEVVKGGQKADIKSKKRFHYSDILEALDFIYDMRDIIRTARPSLEYIMSRIKLEKLNWTTRFGTGEPYYTGLFTGIAWSFKGYVVSTVCNRLKTLTIPVLSVIPVFNRAGLMISFDCILKTRTGYIIITGIKIIAALLLRGKAGKVFRILKRSGRRYGNARTSHRGTNENSHGKHQGNG